MNCKFTPLLVAIVIVAGWSRYSSAQVTCNGVISGIINDNIVCTAGGGCVLDGATIFGNVACSSGTLTAGGSSSIFGNILLNGGITRAELDAVSVLGVVEVKDAASLVELVINKQATLGSVTVENTPGDVFVAGSLDGLEHTGSGNLFANDLSTIASVLVKGGNGIVELCGSSLGGLLVEERQGDVEINANIVNCAQTTLTGGFSASKGSGRVRVIGAILTAGDFSVLEQTGDVILQEARVSDIKLEKNTGSLTMSNVLADSDTTITGQTGNVLLGNLNTIGDFIIKEVFGGVTLADSSFTLEDVSILLVTGSVTVRDNTRLSLAVTEVGGMVEIIDNIIVDGSVSKNTGGVTINNNVFETLSCADNNPPPSGSSNTIGFADGQCATGL